MRSNQRRASSNQRSNEPRQLQELPQQQELQEIGQEEQQQQQPPLQQQQPDPKRESGSSNARTLVRQRESRYDRQQNTQQARHLIQVAAEYRQRLTENEDEERARLFKRLRSISKPISSPPVQQEASMPKKPVTEGYYTPTENTAPRFAAVPKDRIATEKSDVRLQCTVSGHPSVTTTWELNGHPIASSSRIYYYETDIKKIIDINRVTFNDAGVYGITLENIHGKVKALIRLTVEPQEVITEPRPALEDGQNDGQDDENDNQYGGPSGQSVGRYVAHPDLRKSEEPKKKKSKGKKGLKYYPSHTPSKNYGLN